MRYWPKDLNQRCSQSCCCNSPKVILILINATKRTETYTEKERGDPDTNKALQKKTENIYATKRKYITKSYELKELFRNE